MAFVRPGCGVVMQTPSADGLGWDLDRVVECAMCVACSKAIAKPKRCKSCGLARYCSRECQLAHWDTHKFPCKKRGGREGYLAALDVGFNKLASWQSGLVGGHNQADEMIRTLNDTLAAATAIGDAEGERGANHAEGLRRAADGFHRDTANVDEFICEDADAESEDALEDVRDKGKGGKVRDVHALGFVKVRGKPTEQSVHAPALRELRDANGAHLSFGDERSPHGDG